MKIKLLLSTAAIASLLSATPALATPSTATGSLTVTASVAAACTIGSPTLAFGSYNGITQAAKDGWTDMAVTCTNGTDYAIYSTTALVAREMTDAGSDTLTYKLYTDSDRGTELGVDNTASIQGSGDGTSHNVPLYGTIDSGQAAAPGIYSQASVNLTIEY